MIVDYCVGVKKSLLFSLSGKEMRWIYTYTCHQFRQLQLLTMKQISIFPHHIGFRMYYCQLTWLQRDQNMRNVGGLTLIILTYTNLCFFVLSNRCMGFSYNTSMRQTHVKTKKLPQNLEGMQPPSENCVYIVSTVNREKRLGCGSICVTD